MHRSSQSRHHAALAALIITFLLLSSLSLAQQRQALQTQSAAPGGIQPVAHLPGSQRLRLAISLPLRNQDRLDALLQELYDPSSPNYRHFLSTQEFTQNFGPSVVDYQRVIGFAASYGLTITHTFPNRLVLDVNGTVADVERAFQVTINVYPHPTEKRTFYAPDVEPSVEAGLPVLSVEGLSTFSLPHSMLRRASPQGTIHSNQTGSGPGGQFLGSDMRAAYGGGTALDGSGQVVGLIELGPYRLGDVISYFNTLAQPLNVPIVNVLVGVDGVCSSTEPSPGPCDDGEEAIDIQQAIAMAPGLSALIVYEAYGASTDALSAYTQAASDNIAKQLSISFGWGGTPGSEAGYEQVFKELAAQGQSSFVASGDAGASLSGGYPGNSPDITDAGGTDLTTSNSGGPWLSETGWIGSGGGWNSASPIPNGSPNFLWNQTSAINSSNGGDSSYRNIPDVSAEANTDNYFCANGSCQGGIGGTSLAAPRWASFVALINQQALANATASGANPTLGLLNSTIYPLGVAEGASYAATFHDITSGDNDNGTSCTVGTPGCLPNGHQGFDAVAGFDLVTGWGSPNGPTAFDTLFPATTNPNFSMSATPSAIPLTPGGGGTSSVAVKALNGFNATTNLSVVVPGSGNPSYAPAGLTASLSASSIAGGGSPVTLSISTTSQTPGGTYVIAIVGTSGNLTQTAYVTVELPAFVGLSATPAGGISLNQGGTANGTVTATVINGFSSAITLAATGLPSGVTAAFTPVNSTTNTVTFSASASAALTGAGKPVSVTITGTAANSTPQTVGVNLFINPAVSGGSGTPLDLSSADNIYAFYDDANETSITAANSLDGVGFAYSANLLNSGVDFNGTQFNLGSANQKDAIYGGSISLPAGIYTTLQMLATGIEGNQTSQTVAVTYTDNTTSTFTQSFSDWCSALNGNGCVSTGSNPGEAVAVAMPYRDSAGGPDNRVFYLYHYSFALNTNKTVKSLTLPNNRDVVVLAVTLAGPVTTGFTIGVAPGTIGVAQGGNNTTTVTVTPTGGFSGSVDLSVSGLPDGITAAFNPTSTSTTSTLTVSANSAASIGQVAVTVTGTSGNLTENATLNVNVTGPASYSLSAAAASPASVSPGGSSQAAVTIASSNGYIGSVTLTCAIAPAVSPAPTCSFGNTSPVTVTSSGGSATLTFTTVGATGMQLRPSIMFYAFSLPIPGLAIIAVGFGPGASRRKRLMGLLLLGLLLTSLIFAPGCGGGNGNPGGGGTPGTPAGNYTLTITGKDASGTTQTGNAATVTISVN
ncbi:MAG TPA: protease pro-enzyme activation domain-containing protein [Verrucomicrobiae bacterium]|nr:protease pro-enzyme activation domain-containing protein [Verrucomicrobiae bacterium]